MRRKRDESQMGISIKRKDPEQEQLWMAEREQAWRRWEPYWKERTRDYTGAHKKVIRKLRLWHLSDGIGKRDNGYSV